MREQINKILSLGQLVEVGGPADSALEQGGGSHAMCEDIKPETNEEWKELRREWRGITTVEGSRWKKSEREKKKAGAWGEGDETLNKAQHPTGRTNRRQRAPLGPAK